MKIKQGEKSCESKKIQVTPYVNMASVI